MDSRRLIIFIVLSLGLLLLWSKYVTPPEVPTPNAIAHDTNSNSNVPLANNSNNQMVNDSNPNLQAGKIITIATNVIQAQINTLGGDLTQLNLLGHTSIDNPHQSYELLMNTPTHVFITQTGLISNTDTALPNHHTLYTVDKYDYVLAPNDNAVTVNLHVSESNGIAIIKSYTFQRNSYIVNISYTIINHSLKPLTNVSAYWSLLRDEQAPEGETRFTHTFTGPVYYTDATKFETLKFANIVKNDITYPDNINNGWVGFVQHYFSTLWLLNAYQYPKVCANNINCRMSIKPVNDNLVAVGLLTDLPTILSNSSFHIAVPLFAGPQDYRVLSSAAQHLELTKDYGWVYIFATPLFWLLVKIFEFVNNWGLAIILLTFLVKIVLYPLTRASYISMGKMKALAPKMEQLKTQYKDDRTKLQQAIMQMYKTEKVNPIGGCLPMILQVPIFIGLYWALLSSVELRYAPFLWIKDLSAPDPYYILPVVLALTMFLQTYFNPPVADPVQAKMMKIMPVVFSIMFFFFPAGLVIYWLVNNVLTMLQQWYVNKHVTVRRNNRKKLT